MPFKTNVKEEIQRSPIAAVSGAIGVLVATLSLALAWFQYQTPSIGGPPQILNNVNTNVNLNIGNMALIVGYFIAATVSAAIALKALARKHDIAAFFASIPLIALTNFSTVAILFLVPPRLVSAQLFTSAHDIIFYASASIMISFFGRNIIADSATPGSSESGNTEASANRKGPDGISVLFMSLILLGLWSWLVFAGQTRLTRTLLPEITHPIETKTTKSGA